MERVNTIMHREPVSSFSEGENETPQMNEDAMDAVVLEGMVQVLNNFPPIAESSVIGVRAETGGEEEVKACIVPRGDVPDPVSILDWCVERMPRYAVPRYIEFVDELDKTPTGKLRKQDLRDAGITNTTWDREAFGYEVRR